MSLTVAVRTFATLRELSIARTDLELPDQARVADAWTALELRYPNLAPHRPYAQPARNGSACDWDVALTDGDEIAFLPPVSGGAGLVGLSSEPIDVAALEAVVSTRHGAVVTFVGRARDHADDGRTVIELEYEAYPEMAEATLREVAAEAEGRWPECAVAVVHRVGLVSIGEAAVVIVTAAAHRSDAYEANRFVIEAIKDRLPIWKKERFADGSQWKRPGA
jgi:molybdopterin synthase catalytic subunit